MSECSEDEHVLFICSDQSLTFYPENKPFHFKVNMSESIYLAEGETWEMGVVDFYTPAVPKKNGTRELYIFSDLCIGVNVFHNQYSELLRRIFPTSNSWNYIFFTPLVCSREENWNSWHRGSCINRKRGRRYISYTTLIVHTTHSKQEKKSVNVTMTSQKTVHSKYGKEDEILWKCRARGIIILT